MNVKIKYCLFFLSFTAVVSAQQKLTYNSKGELSKSGYQNLLRSRKYEALSAFDTVSLKPLLIYAIYIKNKKLGILDNTAKEITPAIYDGIEGMNISYTNVMFGFHNNFPVKIGNKYGVISNTGKPILPVEYDNIFVEEKKKHNWSQKKEAVIDSFIKADIGEQELYFSTQGKLLEKKEDVLSARLDKLRDNENAAYPNTASNEKPLTTSYGNIIKNLANGFVIVEAKVENKYYYEGLVELATNKLVLPIIYNYLINDQNNNIIAIKNNRCNLYNTKGELALKDTFDGIENLNHSYIIKKDGKMAIFDKTLHQKTDFIFDYFGSRGPDLAVAKIGSKQGVIDSNGTTIIPIIYDNIDPYFAERGFGFAFFKVTKNNKQGLLSKKGNPLTEIVYDMIIPECTIEEPSYSSEALMPRDNNYNAESNDFFIVSKDGKFGLLDNSFNLLIPTEYAYLKKSFNKDFIITGKKSDTQNNELSLVNIKNNKPILPYSYDNFKSIGYQFFIIYQGSLMGVCNTEGKTIIPLANRQNLIGGFYYDYIYNGLNVIYGLRNRTTSEKYIIDYEGTLVNMLKN